jgi:hypothetical protein
MHTVPHWFATMEPASHCPFEPQGCSVGPLHCGADTPGVQTAPHSPAVTGAVFH